MNQRVTDEEQSASRLRLGRFELDLLAGELRGPDGQIAALRRQALDVLLLLGRRAGHVVGKDELMAAIWPGVVVGDGSLAQAVADIRRLLGEAGHRQLRTVARRGYLLVPEPPAGAPPQPPLEASPMDAAGAVAAAPPPAVRSEPVGRRTPHWAAIVGGALIVLGVGLAAGMALAPTGPDWQTPAAAPPLPADAPAMSIAVLPLVVEGGRGDIDWMAQSLHGDLITELARNVPGGKVIARDTMATWDGKPADPRAVARELGVRHVVRGSLRYEGVRTAQGATVRLNLVLIDGETGEQRWADALTTSHATLAQAVGDFAVRIERTLVPEVYRSAAVRRSTLAPEQVDADELAMRAFAAWYRGFRRENVLEALALCERAVVVDPDSIRGWHGVGFLTLHAWLNGWSGTRESALARIEHAAAQLARIEPDHTFSFNTGTIPLFIRGDVAAMLRHTRAWAERHDVPTAHGALGLALMINGHFDDAVRAEERALLLSPRDAFRAEWQYRLAMAHFSAGRYELARDWSLTAMQANPALRWPPVHVAALMQLQQVPEARRHLAEYEARHGRFQPSQAASRLPGQVPAFVEARARLLAALRDAAAD